jgi:hypothetical protein
LSRAESDDDEPSERSDEHRAALTPAQRFVIAMGIGEGLNYLQTVSDRNKAQAADWIDFIILTGCGTNDPP